MSNEYVSEPKPEVWEMEREKQREQGVVEPIIESASTQSSTEQIINAPTRVKAFGKEYEIRQLSIGQVFQASAHIARMALVFQSWGQIQQLETVQERVAGIMEAISYSGESFVGLISVAITEPVEWVREQDSMEALEVLAAVVDRNLPLFSPAEHRTHQKHVRRATGQNIGAWWGYIDDLIHDGHHYETILNVYTLTHLNKFLQVIDNRVRRQRITDAYVARLAQATAKGFRETIRNWEQEDRTIRRAQARAEGRRPDLEMNDYEAEVLETQRQDYFSDWSSSEQQRFRAEQANLWATIPERFREKAERLARGGH